MCVTVSSGRVRPGGKVSPVGKVLEMPDDLAAERMHQNYVRQSTASEVARHMEEVATQLEADAAEARRLQSEALDLARGDEGLDDADGDDDPEDEDDEDDDESEES